MRVSSIVLAALLAGVLVLAAAWHPAEAAECAESPAASRASALYTEGDSAVALSFARQALRQAEQNCGDQIVAVIPLMMDLVTIYQNLQRYSETEKLLRHVIGIKQAALTLDEASSSGAALPNMIIDLDNLAFIYGAQGKFDAAGSLFAHVLEIAEHAVSGNHMLISQALRYLAGNYRARGMHEEAHPLLVRAAEIEKASSDEIAANWAKKPGLPLAKAASWAESLGLLSEESL